MRKLATGSIESVKRDIVNMIKNNKKSNKIVETDS